MSGPLVTRPYDLDRHICRVLERERRLASEYVPPPADQLSLFAIEPVAVRPTWRYVTPSGLVVDDEELFSRAVSLHSAEKAYCARTYAEIVGTAMGRKWKLWWIELFAGPGRLYVRETGEFVPGSPIEAMLIRRPFDGYVFADLDPACAESLRRRVGDGRSVHVLRGDANGADLLDRIAAIVPKNVLVVIYGDQAGLDLGWPTVQFFIDRYRHLDLLLNLPTEGVVRALAAGYETKAATLLDHPAPRQLIETPGRKGPPVRDWYCRRLSAEGFDQIETRAIQIRGRRRDLYDLLMASRNPLAPKFFHEALESFRRRGDRIAS
jgi:three-Cys-motif partner protein